MFNSSPVFLIKADFFFFCIFRDPVRVFPEGQGRVSCVTGIPFPVANQHRCFTINAGSESTHCVTGLHRPGALCPHQRLWLVWPLGSSLVSWPPRRVSHPAGPFPHHFHPQDPRALGPRGGCALLPAPSRVWTSHPCAGPGGRRFCHSPRKTHRGGPIPSEAQDSSQRGRWIMAAGGASAPALWVLTH